MTFEFLKSLRLRRCLLGACIAWLALWALAWLAVPPLLRHQIESRGSEVLGRRVTVGAVDFAPWSLELTLHDVAMASAGPASDASGPQVSLKRLYIDAELQSLLRLAPVVDALVLEQPVVRLTHTGAGHYDVDDLLARFSKPDAPEQPPARFALYNLKVEGGEVHFKDEPAARSHALTELQLGLPFVSSLPADRAVKIHPALSFRLNGDAFDASAWATPFDEKGHAEVALKVEGLDLKPYFAYLPAGLPVRPQAGHLTADLRLNLEQRPQAQFKLAGQLNLSHFKATAAGAPWLGFDALKVDIAGLDPVNRQVHLSRVDWQGLDGHWRRDAQGQWAGWPQTGSAANDRSPAVAPPRSAPAPSWQLTLDELVLERGHFQWRDETTAPVAQWAGRDVQFKATHLHWPARQPAHFSGGFTLQAQDDRSKPTASSNTPSGAAQAARVSFQGQGTDQAASVALRLDGVPLSLAAPYLNAYLRPQLSGTARLSAGLGWRAPDFALQVNELAVDDLKLTDGDAVPLSWRQLVLQGLRVDASQRKLQLGLLRLTEPAAEVLRGRDGRWAPSQWLRSGEDSPVAPVPAASAATPAPEWALDVERVEVAGGQLRWRDRATAGKPVALDMAALQVQAGPWGWGRSEAARQAMPLHVFTRVGDGRTEPGRLDYKGQVGWSPVSAQGQVEIVRFPLQGLEPYFADTLNIELLRADTSFRGQLSYRAQAAGPALQLQGDAAVEDVRTNSVLAQSGADAGPPISDELLSWKALSLRGIDLALAPSQPLALEVKETAVTDLYARVVVNENGRINLQNLVRGSASAPENIAKNDRPTLTSGPKDAELARAATPPASQGPAPRLRFGPMGMVNGRVLFSDRFIQPNFSAHLSDLTGRLSAFSSVSPEGSPTLADLELRGKAEGTAALEVTGQLNPLAKPLAMRIEGKVRDLELPPLSPYSIKYAGHGIERGKLSVNLNYEVLPNGHLTATNNVVLNQLTFGEPVAGAPASLPVRLAVALLADRDGVIDINLPISGSLNDPEFQVGPIIGRVVLNLIGRAITAPFSLLAHALGGGRDDFSSVPFAAGSDVLTDGAVQQLQQVGRALLDRPNVRLTVVGEAHVDAEREAWRRQRLQHLLEAEKRRAALAAGRSAEDLAAITLAEYPVLLKEVYRRAEIPKPRNLIGMAKDLPVPEMEDLLLASMAVPEQALRDLAVQRGVAVRDHLLAQGVPAARIFLGAPHLRTPSSTGGGRDDWQPRAQLDLHTQ